MKILTIILLFLTSSVFATNYNIYSGGTYEQFSELPALNAGDSVFFNRGETFNSFTISNSGASGNPIYIGAYGTGVDPIISGFTTVATWSDLGSNIWESTSAVSSLDDCNMVVINDVNTPIGRFPNSGYYKFDSYTSNTSFVSSLITTDWTGAEVVIRKNRWIIDRNEITSVSGTTVNYTSASGYVPADSSGWFIQNDAETLDAQNEWYYNSITKKIRIYSTSEPTNVKISTVDTLLSIASNDYVTIENINFTGANKHAIILNSAKYITIQNCNISFCGINGIYATGGNDGQPTTSIGLIISYTDFDNINNNSIQLSNETGSATISNNEITNNGVIVGMSQSNDGQCYAMRTSGQKIEISNNNIINVGYIGIGFSGDSSLVQYNFIDTFCFVKDDGAAIYTSQAYYGRKIQNNIILNGIGNPYGTDYDVGEAWEQTNVSNGIYCDDNSTDIEVTGNSVAYCGSGIYLHNTSDITVRNNLTFDCGTNIYSTGGFSILNNVSASSGLNIKNNILVATENKNSMSISTFMGDINTLGAIDSNYYARPIDDTDVIKINTGSVTFYTLPEWQAASTYDDNSNTSPFTVTNGSELLLAYNNQTTEQVEELPYKYKDLDGTEYNGNITLQPFTSEVLFYVGVKNVIAGEFIKHNGKPIKHLGKTSKH